MARGKTVDLSQVPLEHLEEDVQRSARTGGGSGFTPNPEIQQAILNTHQNGGSSAYPGLAPENVGSAISQIRRNAAALEPALSVKFEQVDAGDGTITLKFQGTDKRQYKPREKRETVDA
jgi:hypothetical protein